MSGVPYEVRQRQVAELREKGLTYLDVAAELGISHTHAKRLGSPRSHETSRLCSLKAKRARAGTCERCGGKTRYAGHGAQVSKLCRDCGQATNRERGLAQRGTAGLTAEAIIYLQTPRRYSDVREHFGISSGYTSMLLNRLKGYGLVEQVKRGVWVATDRAGA